MLENCVPPILEEAVPMARAGAPPAAIGPPAPWPYRPEIVDEQCLPLPGPPMHPGGPQQMAL